MENDPYITKARANHEARITHLKSFSSSAAGRSDPVGWQYRYKHENPTAIWSEWGPYNATLASYTDWIEESRPVFAEPKAATDAVQISRVDAEVIRRMMEEFFRRQELSQLETSVLLSLSGAMGVGRPVPEHGSGP